MSSMEKFGVGVIVLFVFSMCGLMSSCSSVPSGFIGVRTTFGKVHDAPMDPGVHFVTPLVDGVVLLETRLISFEVDAAAASKDLQLVRTVISVQHSLAPSNAPASYAAIGDLERFDTSVVTPAVMESLKAVTAKYTAEELITKREAVKQQTSDAIQGFIDHTLQEKGIPGALHIANVAIRDFDFSDGFNASIEAKVKAQQEALRAENEKMKLITEAEASARQKELQADAEAYQIEQLSTQRAAAIKREAEALAQSPLLLQLRAIEKWNGDVPRFVGGAGEMVPFVNITEAVSAK